MPKVSKAEKPEVKKVVKAKVEKAVKAVAPPKVAEKAEAPKVKKVGKPKLALAPPTTPALIPNRYYKIGDNVGRAIDGNTLAVWHGGKETDEQQAVEPLNIAADAFEISSTHCYELSVMEAY